ncbi:apolipoprotein N-acyltransferase, partial [Sinorhizobium meliloti]
MERLAGRIILLSGVSRTFVGFLAGLLAVLAQPPFGIFAAAFVSFPVLVWLIDGVAPDPGDGLLRRLMPPAAIGWSFG